MHPRSFSLFMSRPRPTAYFRRWVRDCWPGQGPSDAMPVSQRPRGPPPKNPGGPPVGALPGRRGETPGAGPPGRCTGRRGEPWRAPRGAPGVVLNSCRLTPPLRGGHAVRAQGRPRRNAAGGSEAQQRGRPGPELPAPVSPSPPCLSRHESGAKCKSKNLALALLKTYLPACRY